MNKTDKSDVKKTFTLKNNIFMAVIVVVVIGIFLAKKEGIMSIFNKIFDLSQSCSIGKSSGVESCDEEVAQALSAGAFVLDVRTPMEYSQGHYPGATLIPIDSLQERMNDLPKDKTIVAYCRTGNRSGRATEFLQANGYQVINGGGLNDMMKHTK